MSDDIVPSFPEYGGTGRDALRQPLPSGWSSRRYCRLRRRAPSARWQLQTELLACPVLFEVIASFLWFRHFTVAGHSQWRITHSGESRPVQIVHESREWFVIFEDSTKKYLPCRRLWQAFGATSSLRRDYGPPMFFVQSVRGSGTEGRRNCPVIGACQPPFRSQDSLFRIQRWRPAVVPSLAAESRSLMPHGCTGKQPATRTGTKAACAPQSGA